MDYHQKVKTKCEALINLIIGIQPFYHKSNDKQKRFIETTIGAAIFYLPKKNSVLFTGKISKEAKRKNEKSEDHLYPRKIAEKINFNVKKEEFKNQLFSSLVSRYVFTKSCSNLYNISCQFSS